MVAEVRKESGALPLLAFAASRLWEPRDREQGLLTREAYQEIGGVAGALAQHAEATLERIGTQRDAARARAVPEPRDGAGHPGRARARELLSVFGEPERADAEEVLNARRRAAADVYERAGESGETHQQVEIVHESLLQAWPRLVRWQTQDADGAQLRDQLRQAAQLWQDRGRPRTCSGPGRPTAISPLWRERYAAALAANEDAFAPACGAAQRTARRRRRRTSRRLRHVTATRGHRHLRPLAAGPTAHAATPRPRPASARPAELLALGRLRLDDYPTAALAHAIASLERADNAPARRFAVEALWRGPTAHVITDPVRPTRARWSPDGRWLALSGNDGLAVLERDGGKGTKLASVPEILLGFSDDGTRLVTTTEGGTLPFHLWSIPEGKLLDSWPHAQRQQALLVDRRLLTFAFDEKAAALAGPRSSGSGRSTAGLNGRSGAGRPGAGASSAGGSIRPASG